MFDDPYRRGAAPEAAAALCIGAGWLARSVGARAIVMLKNDERRPAAARRSLRRLAVIGPLADAPAEMRGPWWGAAAGRRSGQRPRGSARRILPDAEVLHAPGRRDRRRESCRALQQRSICARAADAILLCLGEAAAMSGEAASRAHLGLPGQQRQFAEAVFERRTRRGQAGDRRAVLGPTADRAVAGRESRCRARGLVPGQRGGQCHRRCDHRHASARAAARRSPGRAPWDRCRSFSASVRAAGPRIRRITYTSKYLDVPNEPLFPFGHGLTYGRFTLSNLRVTTGGSTEIDTMEVRVDVLNDGARAAEETVFLFTHDKLASVARPLLELKGFAQDQVGSRSNGHGDAVPRSDANCAFSGWISSPCSSPARWRFWSDRARIARDCSREPFIWAARNLPEAR